jgi:hypothetical protein
MTIVLIGALVLLTWFKPRRSPVQNFLDVFISIVQILVLSFGVTSVHGQPLKDDLSATCIILIVAVGLAVLLMTISKLYQVAARTIFYSVYLSHHSGPMGAASRLLQSILLKTYGQSVFYDIDNMGCIGQIIDAAKVARNVVSVFGSQSLCRPWCIAAIVCAFRNGTPLHTVLFSDPAPTENVCNFETARYRRTFSTKIIGNGNRRTANFEIDTFTLRGHGIVQQEIPPAIFALTEIEPIITNFRSEKQISADLADLLARFSPGLQTTMTVAQATAGLYISIKQSAKYKDGNSMSQKKLPSDLNFTLCDHQDGESVAVSRLLSSVFCKEGNWLEDQDLPSMDFAIIARGGKPSNCVFLFGSNTLTSGVQLARLGLLHKIHQEMHMVPVVIGVTFDMPDENFLMNIQNGTVLALGPDPAGRLAALAGDEVNLRNIVGALKHVMSFLIIFTNIPLLKQHQVDRALRDILTRATGSGRRTSLPQLELLETAPKDSPTSSPIEELGSVVLEPGDAPSAQAPKSSGLKPQQISP